MIRLILVIMLLSILNISATDFEITRLRLNKKYVQDENSGTYSLSFFKNSNLKIEGRVFCNDLDKVVISINGEEFEANSYGTDDEGFTEFDYDYTISNDKIYVILIHAEDSTGFYSDFFNYTMNIKENSKHNEPVVRKIWINGKRVKYGKELFLKRSSIGKTINIQGEIEDVSKIDIDEVSIKINKEKRTAKYWSSDSDPFIYVFRYPLNIKTKKQVYDISVSAIDKKKLKAKAFKITIILK